MGIVWIVLAAVLGLIAAGFLFLFVFGVYVQRRFFCRRYNGNKHLKYFKAEDFQGLLAEPICFASDRGQMLRGFIYRNESVLSPEGLIIFSHGFGAGHTSYTTEVAALARAGFAVLAFDNTGCMSSGGNSLLGFDRGVLDLLAAVSFAENDERLNGLKIALVGHSWGAFSVLNTLPAHPEVAGAVAMCGFVSGPSVAAQTAIPFCRVLMKIFSGVLYLLNRFAFRGRKVNNSIASLRACGHPVLLLYGEKDRTVLYRYNGEKMKNMTADKDNIRFLSFCSKGHNVYLTDEAQNYMDSVFHKISVRAKRDPAQADALYAGVDYRKMTEEDNAVMRTIVAFCKDAVSQSGK